MPKPTPLEDSTAEKSSDKKAYLQKIADLSPNILFVIDLREQRVLFVNKRAEQLLGHDSSYIQKTGIRDIQESNTS